MKAPRRLTWPALRSEIVTGILGLLFIPAGIAVMPMLASEIRTEVRNARVYAAGQVAEAELVEKRSELGRHTIAYEWSEGRAEMVVSKHQYDSVVIGERFPVRIDPHDPVYSVSRFDQRSEGVFPSAIAFAPLLGLVLLGMFFVVHTLRRHRMLVHGISVDFELAGGRRLFGFPVRWRFDGREQTALVDLPVTLSPVPEEPASDAMLLVDPKHPERCVAARRGMFRRAVAWQATAARIASVLSRAEADLPREVNADLRIVPRDAGEAKAWVAVVDGHLAGSRELERWLIGALPKLSPEERRAMCKLSCVRRIELRRTRRIKTSLAFGTAAVAYLASIGSTGEVLWTMPILGAGPIIYVLIGWLGIEDR